MAQEMTIELSLKDNYTASVTNIRNSQHALNKEISEMLDQIDQLNRKRISLRTDLGAAQRALKATRTELSGTVEAAKNLREEAKKSRYDVLQKNLIQVSKQARQAEKDLDHLAIALSRTSNVGNRI